MTTSEKSKLLKQNAICWLSALILPVILHVGLGDTKFPWPLILPFLLIGPMLASNSLLSKASGETTDDPETKTGK
jgi:hypothetical protein